MQIQSNKSPRSRWFKATLFTISSSALLSSAHAATLVQGEYQLIGDSNNSKPIGISVTAGSEGYSTGDDGLTPGGLDGSFNGSILDYAFYTSGSGVVESLGGAASLINLPSSSAQSSDTTGGMNIWAGTTPDGTFSNADQTTYAKLGTVSGTVDITGLGSGSLYMFFSIRTGNTASVTFSLTGAGPTVNLSETGIVKANLGGVGAFQDNTFAVFRADFADAADYTALTYTYDPGSTNAAQSRFAGTVLTDAVPEPSAALLGGLGLLALLRRRR